MPFQAKELLESEDFLFMLAHELRNPLAPIKNALHVLERHSLNVGGNLVKNATNVIHRQVNHVSSIIDDLLDLVKSFKNDLKIDQSEVEICEMIKSAIENGRAILSSRRLNITTTFPHKSIYVKGDFKRLSQIIQNLIYASTKLSETGGKISVTLTFDNSRVMVNIKDNGIGMPREDAQKIFDLFKHRNHLRVMLQGGGLGVGLALSQQIAFLHGGSIEVCSDGLEKGSEFTLILPVMAVEEKSEEEKEEEEKIIQTFHKPMEILVVDDHIDSTESLAVLLKMWGHSVHIAHNYTTALQLAKLFPPDVALLDIGLPGGGDGHQLAKALKKESKNVVLIAISGFGEDVDRILSHSAGFAHHFVKPVNPEVLKDAIISSVGAYENNLIQPV